MVKTQGQERLEMAEKISFSSSYPSDARQVAVWGIYMSDKLSGVVMHHPEWEEDQCFKDLLWVAGLRDTL